jgi:hypothetical protein
VIARDFQIEKLEAGLVLVALEAFPQLGPVRDDAVEARVSGAVNFTHSTSTDS